MLRHWLLAIRPKTLTVAVVPVLVGSALGWVDAGGIAWPVVMAAMIGALLIQAGTNLHNDAADFQRGADDSSTRLGPPRATTEGWLTAAEVRRAAVLSFSGAGLVGAYLIWVGGWPILLVGLLSIAAGLAYTGGPRPIAYSALGELFVWLFFGLAAVMGSYFLQTGTLTATAFLAGAIIGMPAAAVLVVNNYRDLENDRRVGKNTLAVRLGRRVSRIEYALLMLSPFVLLPLLSAGQGSWWRMLPWLVLPQAIRLVRRFYLESPGPVFNQLLAGTARLQLAFGVLHCLGVLAGHWLARPP
jgi:1,4-dihydroxy-2-naphthoate octaprenyltransferase